MARDVSVGRWRGVPRGVGAAGMSLLLGGACPASLPGEGGAEGVHYRRIEVPTAPESDAARARRVRQERAAYEAARQKALAAFVSEDERRCVADADCTLTPHHCCTCAAGGEMDAIHSAALPALVGRRGAACAETLCTQRISDHPTCAATRARCDAGRCVPDVAAAPAPPPTPEGGRGLGVEAIP